MKNLVIATNNSHKLKEFKEILTNYNIISLKDIGFEDDIEETGSTFEENAVIKARAVHEYLKNKNLNYMVLADDSGLCVDSLNGAPGIYSARYAGNHDSKANRNKLLNELKDKPSRDAHFTCAIVICYEDGSCKTFIGKTYGKIAFEEIGSTDFGYDCIFYSKDLNKTFGEASEEEKNSVSHRGRAIQEMLKGI